MELVLFLGFSLIAIVAGGLVVFHPHPVKSALALVVSFFAIGGLYLLLQAEFIALMQVLVYAGAVMVLFLFVIMLLNLRPREQEKPGYRERLRFAGPLAAVFLGALLTVIYSPLARIGRGGGMDPQTVEAQGGNIRVIGRALFTDYLLPFEVTSILLLVAVVGVIVLAKRQIK
jgi:NADH-quinone oxidoreductase subunit J